LPGRCIDTRLVIAFPAGPVAGWPVITSPVGKSGSVCGFVRCCAGVLHKNHCRPSDLRREGWVLTHCSYSGYSNLRLKANIQPPSTSRCQCPLTRWLIFKVVVSNCPGAVIGIPDPVAAVGEPEFSIPVVQSEKTEYDFLRFLWGRSCLSLFWEQMTVLGWKQSPTRTMVLSPESIPELSFSHRKADARKHFIAAQSMDRVVAKPSLSLGLQFA